MNDIDRQKINEYKQQISIRKNEQDTIRAEQKRMGDRWSELNQEIYELEKNINTIEAETFRQECLDGLHKVVKSSEIPNLIWLEREKIYERISGGCKGDWEVGCRGCEHECGIKATNEFMRMYNIEKIITC